MLWYLLQLELKLGLGGTSYEDFIRTMHLPLQLRYVPWIRRTFMCLFRHNFLKILIVDIVLLHLDLFSQVDPIVASFSGGAVGVISALMLIETNNVEQQEKKRCKYCHGTGMA